MRAAHGTQPESDLVKLRKIIDVAKAQLVDREALTLLRISGREKFVLLHPLGTAKERVCLLKDKRRFEQKGIQRFSGMMPILAPGKNRLPLRLLPAVMVHDRGCPALGIDSRLQLLGAVQAPIA